MDTKLHEAVRYGDICDVLKALGQGYDPNLIGLYEWTPVHEASHNGALDILKLLLRNKGDANASDHLRGNTAVHYAAEQDHLDCLKVLLGAKGQADIFNHDGKSALDIATGDCKSYLQQCDMEMATDSGDQGRTGNRGKDDHNNNMDTEGKSDPGERSRRSSTGVSGSESKEEFPAMGHLHLSFEFHLHKRSLKIRVWQVSDLLLPPPHTSMINTIFVRSYLIPDKPKKTNRRTEEAKVAPSEAHFTTNRTAEEPGIQYVFTPSNFHFSSPLIYTGVTQDIIDARSVQLEVCMTQRYTKRIFLIAMINIPLKVAVKRPIREKYALIPCMNYTIPNNMRIYSASELQLESNMGMFYSLPMLRDPSSLSVPNTARSASDVELQGISIHGDVKVPSVSIDMRNGSIEDYLHPDEVKVKRKIVPDFSSIDIPGSVQVLPGQLEEVKVQGQIGGQCVVDMETESSCRKLKVIKPPRFNGDMEIEMEPLANSKYLSVDAEENGLAETSVTSPCSSRPETPVWDFYDFDDCELGMEPVDDGTDYPAETNIGDSNVDYKGVSLSPLAVEAMTGKSPSKVTDDVKSGSYIPTIIVDDIENEDEV